MATIGTGINAPPAVLVNTLNAITQKYIHPEIADNAFTPSPALQWMTRNGRRFVGGELVYPLVTAEEVTGGAYYGDQILQTQIVDSIQPANQLWRFYYQSVPIPLTDLVIHAGAHGDREAGEGEVAGGHRLAFDEALASALSPDAAEHDHRHRRLDVLGRDHQQHHCRHRSIAGGECVLAAECEPGSRHSWHRARR